MLDDSEDSSGSSGERHVAKPRRAGKALRDFRERRRAMRKHPVKHIKRYVWEAEEVLGVSADVAYNLSDYTRKLHSGKQKSLYRIHFAVSEILAAQLRGKREQAALQSVQLLRCLHQVCLDGGSWRAGSLLLQHQDPLERPRFGGEASQLEHIASYLKAVQELEKKNTGGGDQGEDEVGGKNGRRKGKKADESSASEQ